MMNAGIIPWILSVQVGGDTMNPDTITKEAVRPIKEYCKSRKYKCEGCRYSIKWLMPYYKGCATCVFANCPCDWTDEKRECMM